MKQIQLFFLLVILALLNGCIQSLGSETSSVMGTPTYRVTDTPITTSISTVITVTDSKPVNSTPTLIVPSRTPTPRQAVQIQCLTISENLPDTVILEGALVLASSQSGSEFILDMRTGGKTNLSNFEGEIVYELHLSPDRNLLAATMVSKDSKRLIIKSADERVDLALPWLEAWDDMPGWFDNQRLWLRKWIRNSVEAADILGLYNPFTGQVEEIPFPFSDFYEPYLPRDWEFEYAYDPNLSRVLYMSNDGVKDPLILRDLQNGEILARFPMDEMSFGRSPQWSPDGEQVIVVDSASEDESAADSDNGLPQHELFGIQRNGQIVQLTEFATDYSNAIIGRYTWSPNGRYLAFWFASVPSPLDYVGTNPMPLLTILDTQTRQITNYCVPGDTYTGRSNAPIWSPDSQQLLVENVYNEQYESRIILVDINIPLASVLFENQRVLGWMMTP